jgi:predicted alpha/beta-hydrolase family hydrolase
MKSVSEQLAEREIKVVRFEFPYMQERRKTGKKRPPNTKKVLLQTWTNAINDLKPKHEKIYIGGKSMGGRMATLIEDDTGINGIICLGFPFHAPGKAPGDRIDHLKSGDI